MALNPAALLFLRQLQYTATPAQIKYIKILWIDKSWLIYIKINMLG
jgi:hypothetical protein